ncbi:MAG: VOC family protein, partial [Cytophagales bacterium CG17_big_fil_post_rev_8_21_14_2_50_40_13]
MTFYHQCFGGEIQFQTLGDSPLGSQLNPEMQSYIIQASIKTHHF